MSVLRELHNCIHSREMGVTINSTYYEVEISRNGLRFIRYGDSVLVAQSPQEGGALGLLASQGPVTKVLRSGREWSAVYSND